MKLLNIFIGIFLTFLSITMNARKILSTLIKFNWNRKLSHKFEQRMETKTHTRTHEHKHTIWGVDRRFHKMKRNPYVRRGQGISRGCLHWWVVYAHRKCNWIWSIYYWLLMLLSCC